MIEMSDVARDTLTGSVIRRYVRVESWLDGELVAAEVPVIEGTETGDAGLGVPERLTFTVPLVSDDTSWIPTTTDAPLGAFGQRVRVSLGIDVSNGQTEWINRGWFVLNSTELQGDSLSVECLGLLTLVDEAELPTEYQPKAGATLVSIVRALIEPGITVVIEDDAPADRSVASTITFSDNRLDCVLAIRDAWPASFRITEEGFLSVGPVESAPTDADVVLELSDQAGGTLVEAGAAVSREGAFNGVVAKGQYPDTDPTRAGQEIVATVYDTSPTSPYRRGGPFSPYLVPYQYASPLLTLPTQVKAAGASVLRRLRRSASQTVSITAVPHPGIQLGDVVRVTSSRLGLAGELGIVDGYSLPYTAGQGAMTLTVRLED